MKPISIMFLNDFALLRSCCDSNLISCTFLFNSEHINFTFSISVQSPNVALKTFSLASFNGLGSSLNNLKIPNISKESPIIAKDLDIIGNKKYNVIVSIFRV